MHQLRAAQPAESYKVVERERKIDHDLSRLLSQPRYCMSGRAFGVFFYPIIQLSKIKEVSTSPPNQTFK